MKNPDGSVTMSWEPVKPADHYRLSEVIKENGEYFIRVADIYTDKAIEIRKTPCAGLVA
jgi:hypothetical protein